MNELDILFEPLPALHHYLNRVWRGDPACQAALAKAIAYRADFRKEISRWYIHDPKDKAVLRKVCKAVGYSVSFSPGHNHPSFRKVKQGEHNG